MSPTRRWAPLAVALTAIAVYANTLRNGFAFDDEFLITGNARVHQLADQASIWLTPYWPDFGAEAGLYRPLAVFAWAVQWAIADGGAWLFHLVSIGLHALVSVLVFHLLLAFVPLRGAVAGALLFAVHPVHVEAVANVVGQAELLAAAAALAACLLWLRSPQERTTSYASIALLAGLMAAALLSKESAIVLPALLLALDAARGRFGNGLRAYVRARGPAVAALAGTVLLYSALRVRVLGSFTGGDAAPSLPFLRTGQRGLVALQTWPEYLRLMVWPFDLSADYSPDVIVPAAGWTPAVLLGALLLAVVVLLAVRTHRRPLSGLPAAWFLIAILPVSNLILPVGVVLAERLLYLPSVSIALAAGALIGHPAVLRSGKYRGVPVPAAVMVTLLFAFALRTAVRNPDWRDTPAYWNALVRDHPESYRAQWGVGAHLVANGDPVRGLGWMTRAVETWPHDAALLDEVGLLQLRSGQAGQAVETLERALALPVVGRDTRQHLAEAYLAADRPADALALLAPTDSGPPVRLALQAQALDALGHSEDAARAWTLATGTSARLTWRHWALAARAFARADDPDRAAAAVGRAASDAPDADARAALDRLALAIRGGCYARDRRGAACEDALDGWLLLPSAGVYVNRTGQRGADPEGPS